MTMKCLAKVYLIKIVTKGYKRIKKSELEVSIFKDKMFQGKWYGKLHVVVHLP